MRKEIPHEPCPMESRDCAALMEDGLCRALVNIDYGPEKPCPFYKSDEQNAQEIAKSCYRLASLKRYDLVRKCI